MINNLLYFKCKMMMIINLNNNNNSNNKKKELQDKQLNKDYSN